MSDAPTATTPRVPPRLVRFTPGAAMIVTAAVFSAFVLRNAFVAAHQVVGWIVACSIMAVLIDPLVNGLQRFVPRAIAVTAVVLGMLGLVGGVLVGFVQEVLRSLDDLERAAPEAARELEERYRWAADVDVTARVADLVDRMNDAIRSETIESTLGRAPTYLVTGVLMLFLLGYGRRYVLGLLRLSDDLERRQLARRVVLTGARRGRFYILCALAHSLVNGIVFGAACKLFGLPAPLSLGLAVALLTPIPLIGVLVGGVPALLLAFGSEAWWVGATVFTLLVVLQTVEVLVVRPFVDRRSVRLGTTVAVVVTLLAFELYGLGAAIFALALAVISLAALDVYGAQQDEEWSATPSS